jgi:hypothetical protein
MAKNKIMIVIFGAAIVCPVALLVAATTCPTPAGLALVGKWGRAQCL